MPIYEYVCEACRREFEVLVPMAQRDEVACEGCGRPQATRLASTFSAAGSGDAAGAILPGGACCGPGGCGHCGH